MVYIFSLFILYWKCDLY